MAKYVRLTGNHPDFQKVEKLFAFADELGISISCVGYETVVYVGDNHYRLMDIEANPKDMPSTGPLPPGTEWKLVKNAKS